jgi:hypothetical protein
LVDGSTSKAGRVLVAKVPERTTVTRGEGILDLELPAGGLVGVAGKAVRQRGSVSVVVVSSDIVGRRATP